VLIVGIAPVMRAAADGEHAVVGWFGERHDLGLTWAPAVWSQCYECSTTGPVHTEHSYVVRPCGHHQSGSWGHRTDPAWLDALWRTAGNKVQWRPRPERIGDVMDGIAAR
jgi:hypothetical protein